MGSLSLSLSANLFLCAATCDALIHTHPSHTHTSHTRFCTHALHTCTHRGGVLSATAKAGGAGGVSHTHTHITRFHTHTHRGGVLSATAKAGGAGGHSSSTFGPGGSKQQVSLQHSHSSAGFCTFRGAFNHSLYVYLSHSLSLPLSLWLPLIISLSLIVHLQQRPSSAHGYGGRRPPSGYQSGGGGGDHEDSVLDESQRELARFRAA